MTTARHTVLRIPELLEAILLQLTPLELIKSQRVSKSFQAMIRQSPSIQRRLGFRLPPNITSEKKDATRNPLLDRFLSPTSFPHRAIHSTTHWRQRSPRWQATRISVDIEAGGRDLFVRLPVDIRVLFDWRKPSVILSEPRHDAYRDMLIADSPVDVYIWRHKFGHQKIAGVGDGRVLTCGELVEKCHEYFRIRHRYTNTPSYEARKSISVPFSKICKFIERRNGYRYRKSPRISELLEVVLLALPPLDIIVAQRVDKNFRDAVKASTKIQQKLFYRRPLGGSADGEGHMKINPLLSHFLKHFSIEAESFGWDSHGRLVLHDRHGIFSSEDICNRAGQYVTVRLSPVGGTALPPPPWNGSYANMSIFGFAGRRYHRIC